MSTKERTRGSIGEFIRRPYVRHIFVIWVFVTIAIAFFAPVQSRLMGNSASLEMDVVKETMTIFTFWSAPVAGLVISVALYSLFGWRNQGGQAPTEDGSPMRGNSKVVVGWLVGSSVLCVMLLVWGLAAMSESHNESDPAKIHTVNVVGNQWIWNFDYTDDGNFSTPVLYLPVDEPVMFNITSVDVIHSFWIVEMGVKMDANPHETTHMRVTPIELGVFNVRCAELCGLNHSAMFTKVHVVSKSDYKAWVDSMKGSAQ